MDIQTIFVYLWQIMLMQGDVVSSFSNTDDLDVDCHSNLINLDKTAIIFLLMILF